METSDINITEFNSIAIVGRPRVGKTTIAIHMSKPRNHQIIHTDDYISLYPFEEVPYKVIRDIKCLEEQGIHYIVEGVQVARMLKMARELEWKPQAVVEIEALIPVLSKHVSIAAMVRKNLNAWKQQPRDNIQFFEYHNEAWG